MFRRRLPLLSIIAVTTVTLLWGCSSASPEPTGLDASSPTSTPDISQLLDADEKANLQARTWLAECDAADCQSVPTFAPAWLDASVKAQISRAVPHVAYIPDGEPIYGGDGSVRDEGLWIHVKDVFETDVRGVVRLDAGTTSGNAAGVWRTYLYRWNGTGWEETTSEETGVPTTVVVG